MSSVRPTREFDTAAEMLKHLNYLLQLLGELCADPGLTEIRVKSPRHPAIVIYDSIENYVKTGRVPIRDEFQYIRRATRLNLDRMTWASSVGEGTALSRLGGQEMVSFVTKRSRNPDMFDDVGAELYFWGWLLTQGFKAQIVEQEGLPDIEVQGSSNFWCEVKRVKPSSSSERVRAVLKKASKQIKRADPNNVGVVFIHIDRDLLPESITDEIPGDVAGRITCIEQTLNSDYCRSVGLVVAAWDEVFFKRDDNSDVQHYATRRRSIVLRHANPRSELPVEPERLRVGMTAVWRLINPIVTEVMTGRSKEDTSVDPYRITFTGTFRRFNEGIERVGESRVVSALRTADSISSISIHEMVIFIGVKKISLKSHTYLMLMIGIRRRNHDVEVNDIYRVRVKQEEADELVGNPVSVFNKFLDKFGVLVQVGNVAGKFIPHAIVNVEGTRDLSFIGFPREESDVRQDLDVRAPYLGVYENNGKRLKVTAIYGVDLKSYRSALERRAVMI